MFRVKKDDYNTVQFIPEYKSTSKSKNSTMVSPKRSRSSFKVVISAILFIIIILAAAAFFVYLMYFSPSRQFLSALDANDIKTATEICKDNAYDEDFLKKIEPTVTDACNKISNDYMGGKISSEEAMQKLSVYNDITDKNFSEQIANISSKISSFEEIENSKKEIETTAASGDMAKTLQLIAAIKTKAENSDIEIDSYISDIMNKYAIKFKTYAFNAVSDASRSKKYDTVVSNLTFMNTYLKDEAVTNMLTQIEAVKNNNISARAMRSYVRDELKKLQSSDN